MFSFGLPGGRWIPVLPNPRTRFARRRIKSPVRNGAEKAEQKGGTPMIERGRISAGQMAMILFISTFSIDILTAPNLAAKWADRDMWLSPLVASVSGLVAFSAAYRLHRRFPGETIIQYSPRILGWFGKGIALLYWVIYIHANSFVIRFYADFVNGVFLPETPQAVVMAGMALLCAAAVRGGIGNRCPHSQRFFPVDRVHHAGDFG